MSRRGFKANPRSASPAEWNSVTAMPERGLRLQQMLDRLPAGAYACDANGLIMYYNQRAVEIWGRTPRLNNPDDRFNGSFRLYSAETGAPIALDQCWMALALRKKTRYNDREIVIERPDGERVAALVNVNPIWSDSGILLGAANAFIDISARQRFAEERVQQRGALANRSGLDPAGEMAAGFAHELNQPLTAIINYSEACANLLRSGTAGIEELSAAIEQITTQGQRAVEIIRRLLALVHRAPLQREPVDLPELIRRTIHDMGITTAALRQRVRLRLELAESLPVVEANFVQIQQVLVNLLRNALEALSAPEVMRRELTIRAELTADATVVVTVRDTGHELAEGVQERLFDLFFTTKPGGMGFGLPICKSIIEAYGGRLWVTTARGGGTSFHFTVPCARARELGCRRPGRGGEGPLPGRRTGVPGGL